MVPPVPMPAQKTSISPPLGVADDVERDAVLHRAARVEVLALDVDVALDVRRDTVELDDRRVADRLDDIGARALHHDQSPSLNAKASSSPPNRWAIADSS